MVYNKKVTSMKKRSVRPFLAAAVLLIITAFAVSLILTRSRVPSERRVTRRHGANLLLITLDTTRPDRIGAYSCSRALTPEIDRLAGAGVLFENAYAPVPLTLPSHASILTGTTPLYHGVRNNGKYLLPPPAVTMAEIFKTAGYATAAFVASFILDSRFGLDQGFDDYGDRMDDASTIKSLESERRADSVVNDFERWLERSTGRPFFVWLHFFDPHFPYDPPEPFRSDPRLPDPYDGEIAFMDVHVGKAVRLLEEKGLLDRTVVILAGDHGEAFGEHKENGHTIFCYEENIRVPLVFFGPGFWPRGLRIPQRASLVDILPTALDLLELKVPGFVQGRSLIPLVEGRRFPESDLYFESLYSVDVLGCAPLQGLLSGPYKFIRLPRPELYDLVADPAEEHNLVAEKPEQASRLLASLSRMEKEQAGSEWLSERRLSREEKQRLAALGYLSAGGRKAQTSSFDPKDRIDFWNRSREASALRAGKKFAEAERLFLSLFEEDPHFHPVIEDLGELYFEQKRISELVDVFERAVGANPDSCGLRIAYARHLVRAGLAERALPLLQEAETLAGPDEMEHVHFTRGNALGRLGRYEEAARSFERVLELEPENFEAARLLGYSLMQLGKFEEALASFRAAEKGIPENARLLEDIAMTLANLRRFEEAIPYFERAAKAAPAPALYANYALACAEVGDYARAVALMETAVSLPDADPDLRALGRRHLAAWRSKGSGLNN